MKINNKGFALIVALLVMAIAMASIIAISSTSKVGGRLASLRLHEQIARQNARSGLEIALAEIQDSMGSDLRCSRFKDDCIEIFDTKTKEKIEFPTIGRKVFLGETSSNEPSRYPNKNNFSYTIVETGDWWKEKMGLLTNPIQGGFQKNLIENFDREAEPLFFINETLQATNKIPGWGLLKSYYDLSHEARKGHRTPKAPEYPISHGVGPVLYGFSCEYGAWMDINKRTLTIIPEVNCTLWNPYDVALDAYEYTLQWDFDFGKPRIEVVALGEIVYSTLAQYSVDLTPVVGKRSMAFAPGEVREFKLSGTPYVIPITETDLQEFLKYGIKLRYYFQLENYTLGLLDANGTPFQKISNIKPLYKSLDSRVLNLDNKNFKHSNVLRIDLFPNDILMSNQQFLSNVRASEHLCLPEKKARSRFETEPESKEKSTALNKRYTWQRNWTAPDDAGSVNSKPNIPFEQKILFHFSFPDKKDPSIAVFSQANLTPMGYDPLLVFGESRKHELLTQKSFLEADAQYPVIDYAWFLNDALWDRFYINDDRSKTQLYREIKYNNQKKHSFENQEFASNHFINHAFNVNSFSEKEWEELLEDAPFLAAEERESLAKQIAHSIGKKEKPFSRVSEFVNRDADSDKGILQKALDDLNIRHVSQGQILECIGGRLLARDDTLCIRVRADSLNDAGEVVAEVECEAIAQRFPEEHFEHTGRRFKVIAFRWLN